MSSSVEEARLIRRRAGNGDLPAPPPAATSSAPASTGLVLSGFFLLFAVAIGGLVLGMLALKGLRALPPASTPTSLTVNYTEVLNVTTQENYTIYVNNTAELPDNPNIMAGCYGSSMAHLQVCVYGNSTVSSIEEVALPTDWPMGGGATGTTLNFSLVDTGITPGQQCPDGEMMINGLYHGDGTLYEPICVDYIDNALTNETMLTGDAEGMLPTVTLVEVTIEECVDVGPYTICFDAKGRKLNATEDEDYLAAFINADSTFISDTLYGNYTEFNVNVLHAGYNLGGDNKLITATVDIHGLVTFGADGTEALTVDTVFDSADIEGVGPVLTLVDKGRAGTITCPVGSFFGVVEVEGPGTIGDALFTCIELVFPDFGEGAGLLGLYGTVDQIEIVTVVEGNILQIKAAQDINTTSSPTFDNLRLTGFITAGEQVTRPALAGHSFSMPWSGANRMFDLIYDDTVGPFLSIGALNCCSDPFPGYSVVFAHMTYLANGSITMTNPSIGGVMLSLYGNGIYMESAPPQGATDYIMASPDYVYDMNNEFIELGPPLYVNTPKAWFGLYVDHTVMSGIGHYVFHQSDSMLWFPGGYRQSVNVELTVERPDGSSDDAYTLLHTAAGWGPLDNGVGVNVVFGGTSIFGGGVTSTVANVDPVIIYYISGELYIAVVGADVVDNGSDTIFTWDHVYITRNNVQLLQSSVVGDIMYWNNDDIILRASLTLVSSMDTSLSNSTGSMHVLGYDFLDRADRAVPISMVTVKGSDAFIGWGMTAEQGHGTQLYMTDTLNTAYALRRWENTLYLQYHILEGSPDHYDANNMARFDTSGASFYGEQILLCGMDLLTQFDYQLDNDLSSVPAQFQISAEGTSTVTVGFNLKRDGAVWTAADATATSLGYAWHKAGNSFQLLLSEPAVYGAVVVPTVTLEVTGGGFYFNSYAYFDAPVYFYDSTHLNGYLTDITGIFYMSNLSPFEAADGSSWVNGNLIVTDTNNIVVHAETQHATITTVVYIGASASSDALRAYDLRIQRTGNVVNFNLCAPSSGTVTLTGGASVVFDTTSGGGLSYNMAATYRPICTSGTTYLTFFALVLYQGAVEMQRFDITCSTGAFRYSRQIPPFAVSPTYAASSTINVGCQTFTWMTNRA